MKKLPYILYVVMALILIALIVIEVSSDKTMDTNTMIRFGLMVVTLGLAIARTISNSRHGAANKKTAYKNAYEAYIGTAFSWDSKLEKQLFKAIDDYNQNKHAAALEKLSKLRPECRNSADVFAVTVFQGLCHDDMRLYEKAVEYYFAAQQIRPTSTVASNMGLCYENMGKTEDAMLCYEQAIRLDSQNAFPLNNLAHLYIRSGDYGQSMEYARKALELYPNMPQALNAMAICCHMLGDQEGYETYYRRAVANGSDGKQLKTLIAILGASVK